MEAITEVHLLGNVQIKQNGKPVSGFESRKALALFCYLADMPQPVPRGRLAQLFWGDKSESNARANLSRVLHNNAVLIPNCVELARDVVQFKPTTNVRVDVAVFMELSGRKDIHSLTKAVALYDDVFMADIALNKCTEFETWLLTEQEAWRHRLSNALLLLISAHKDNGNYIEGLQYAFRLLYFALYENRSLFSLLEFSKTTVFITTAI
ncbi:MAG: hypothetical protein R2911_01360 [Caldilineaceae bacterium]